MLVEEQRTSGLLGRGISLLRVIMDDLLPTSFFKGLFESSQVLIREHSSRSYDIFEHNRERMDPLSALLLRHTKYRSMIFPERVVFEEIQYEKQAFFYHES